MVAIQVRVLLDLNSESKFRLNGYCTGSSPVLTAEGANPETLKDKVGDSRERPAL